MAVPPPTPKNNKDTTSVNHLLFLHQNDHPGLILISKKLVGSENYNSWRRSMVIALNAKNKLKIITNEYQEPTIESPLRALWERNNDMIISWILNTVTDQIGNNLSFVYSASALWQELQEHYSQLDGHIIYQLTNEITQLKQTICSVEMRLNGAREGRKRLLQFLMRLDECFSNVRGQILLMKPLSNTIKVYAMLKQEEKQKESTTPQYLTPTVTSTFTNSRQSQSTTNTRQNRSTTIPNTKKITFKPGVICGNCQKEGHYQNECYQLVGYPVGHPLHGKFKPGSGGSGNGSNRTTNFKPRTVKMVATQTNGQEGTSSEASTSNGTHGDAAVFAKMDSLQNQLNQVMLMLQNPQGQCDPKLLAAGRYLFISGVSLFKDAWVVDSGASDHICISIHLMFNIIQCIITIIVSLPNGHTVIVTTVGFVSVKPNLVLHNAFYIPSFAYNLLSGNNKRITHGILSDGLYIIKPNTTSTPTPTESSQSFPTTVLFHSSNLHLWHAILEVNMTIPSSYKKCLPPNTVCRLKKSLYGLKQANRQWFIKLTTPLISIGFNQSHADSSLFTYYKDTDVLILLIYVDNILLADNNLSLIKDIKTQLPQTFSIKDLGLLHHYLGIKFLKNSTGMVMTQRKCALDLISYAKLQDEKPAKTPLDSRVKLTYTDGEPLLDPSHYRTLVGKLIYLTISRPDIAFAAQLLSQFSHNPHTPRLEALHRVIRYIKLSPGTSLISWNSKKQPVVSRSFTEAEYRALTDCSCKITWLCSLLQDLRVLISTPIRILYDNISTIALASNPIQHARTKHIEIDCHFVRDKIKAGQITISYVPTNTSC
uniref:Cysteine-rich RLK (Receptor-like protein kinase) 8 n=1 Tax=Tanacetum cinerariifolium TaxID=118510 RepID=A0A6L2MRY6_TANCI|nr:cysteine-rich RLK (receptor-like protein kinase) 8 [Tanacetum cinerariifolium]